MEKQFVLAHTNRQTDIPTLLRSWFTNTSYIKMLCSQQNACPYIFVKTLRARVLVCLVSVNSLFCL